MSLKLSCHIIFPCAFFHLRGIFEEVSLLVDNTKKSLSKNATRWENVSFSWNKFEYEKRLRKIRWFLKFNSKVCKIQVCSNFNSYKMLLSKKDKKCRLRIKNEMWNFLSNHMKKIKSIYKICNMLNSKWNQEPSTKGLFLLIFQFSQLS